MSLFYYETDEIVIGIYICAALLPAILLMNFIYKQDKIEQESPKLLAKLFFSGVFSAIPAVFLEFVSEEMIIPLFPYVNYKVYAILTALFVGLIEEGCKFFFLYRKSWYDPEFDYRFDGVIYAVFVSLGFAAIENILYVFQYGISVAVFRAVLAVPAHMGFAVFMGYFYGLAKVYEVRGISTKKSLYLIISYLSAVAFHTFYDATLMVEETSATIVFIIFVIVMYFVVYKQIKKASKEDTMIY